MLKPGNLALVIGGWHRQNTGKCVTLMKLVDPGEVVVSPEGEQFHNWTHNPVWLVNGDVITEFFSGRIIKGCALFRPHHLVPLEDPDLVVEKEKEFEHSN